MCVLRVSHNTNNVVLLFTSVALIELSQARFIPERSVKSIFICCGNLHFAAYNNFISQAWHKIKTLSCLILVAVCHYCESISTINYHINI